MKTTMRTCIRFDINHRHTLTFDTETMNIANFAISNDVLDIRTYNEILISRTVAEFNQIADMRHFVFNDVSYIKIFHYTPPLQLVFDDGEPTFTLYDTLPEAIKAKEDLRHNYISRYFYIKDANGIMQMV